MRSTRIGVLYWVVVLASVFPAAVWSQESADWKAAQYLPPDVALIVEGRNLGNHWDDVVASPVYQRVMQIPRVQRELKSGNLANWQFARTVIASVLGAPLEDFAQEWSRNGVWLALKNRREVAILFRPAAEESRRLAKTLKEFVSAAALTNARNSRPQLFATTYRELEAYGLADARIAFCEDWVVISSTRELGKEILDRMLHDSGPCLADQAWFQDAKRFAESMKSDMTPALSAAVDLSKLRELGQIPDRRGVDPGAELLFGGIQDAIASASTAVARLELGKDVVRVAIGAPYDARTNPLRDYFFGDGELQPAPHPLEISNRILSGRWHRDIGLFWKMAPQIIQDENALAGIAKAESDISTLLGGMVTISDVFRFIGPDVEFVAVQPTYAADSAPSIQIPPFGIAGSLRDVDKAQPALRLGFQQIVSFANLNASSRMYPPLEIMSEKVGDTTFITANYFQMNESDISNQPGADIYKNFAPTLGFRGERFALASNRELAEQLLAAQGVVESSGRDESVVRNTIIELWPMQLAKAGDLNREALIAQQMLNSGKSHEDARTDVEMVLDLIRQFESAKVELRVAPDSIIVAADAKMVPGSHVSQ